MTIDTSLYRYPKTYKELYNEFAPLIKEKAIEYAKLTDMDNPDTIKMMKHSPSQLDNRIYKLETGMKNMIDRLDERFAHDSLDISLEELSNSDEFLRRVKEADAATRRTDREHGFQFCKDGPDGEIVFGSMCEGKHCSLSFEDEFTKCPTAPHTFHTHPTIAFQKKSMWSPIDFIQIAASSLSAHAPRIGCVKSIDSDDIWCEKMHISDHDLFKKLLSIETTPISESEFDTRQEADEAMFTLAKSTFISIPIDIMESDEAAKKRPQLKHSGGLHPISREHPGWLPPRYSY